MCRNAGNKQKLQSCLNCTEDSNLQTIVRLLFPSSLSLNTHLSLDNCQTCHISNYSCSSLYSPELFQRASVCEKKG